MCFIRIERCFSRNRKEKLSNAKTPSEAGAPLADLDDVEMKSEMGQEQQKTPPNTPTSEKDMINANIVAQAALEVSAASADALAEKSRGDAQLLAYTAISMSQASLELAGDKEEDASEASLIHTAAKAAEYQSCLLTSAAKSLEAKADINQGADDKAGEGLGPDYMFGSSAADLVQKPATMSRSDLSLSSSRSESVNKGVAEALALYLRESTKADGATGGYLTMDDLRNCLFTQGMHLRYRRFRPGVLPRLPRK